MSVFKTTLEMEIDTKSLSEEYSKRFNHVYLWPLKLAGYLRFETKDGRFINKLTSTIIRSIVFISLGNISAAYLLFGVANKEEYLTLTEILSIACLSITQNSIVINISFFNKNSGIQIINTCIHLDVILGIKETKFMRDIVSYAFFGLTVFITSIQIIIIILLFFAHKDRAVSMITHVVANLYLYTVFMGFFDLCFLVAFHNFLTMRIHYMNIALIKLSNLNPTYFANQFYFNGILWKKAFESLVTFHERTDTKQFIKVFVIIFEQLRLLEKCFRFTMLMAITALVVGTFVGVQAFILHKELSDVNILRTISVIGFPILSWIYLFSLTQPIDMFYRQIEKTKLICTFIQLKPFMSTKVLKITKGVLGALGVYEPRVSVYCMFYVSTSLVLKMAASLFVFITVQLQLATPSTAPADYVAANVTAAPQMSF